MKQWHLLDVAETCDEANSQSILDLCVLTFFQIFNPPSATNSYNTKMDTAVQSYKVLTMIGKNPLTGPNEVGGEETDSVVNKVTLGFFGIVAITAIVSGGEK